MRALLRTLAIPFLALDVWLARRRVDETRRRYLATGRLLEIADGPHAGETAPVYGQTPVRLWDELTDRQYEYRPGRTVNGDEYLILHGATGPSLR